MTKGASKGPWGPSSRGQSRKDHSLGWEAGVRGQTREEDLSCPTPSPSTYDLVCVTAVVGPPEV